MDKQVFISYARQDGLSHAEWLEQQLPACGVIPWRDKRGIDPAKDFTSEIEKAIKNSAYVIVCITKEVEERPDSFVRNEVHYARILKKPVIIARFEDAIPPVNVVTNTWLNCFPKRDIGIICEALGQPVENHYLSLKKPDRFQDYLDKLRDKVGEYLEAAVQNMIPLRSGASEIEMPPLQVNVMGDFFEGLAVHFQEETLHTEKMTEFDTFEQAIQHYGGRVLLLGEPGAGKTITLTALARDAISRRLDDPNQPLPILARIAGWNAEQQPSLMEWLAGQMGVSKSDLESEAGRLLLLLDGLDELGESREVEKEGHKITFDPRKVFIEKMGAQWGENRVVITSRVREYHAVGEKVRLKGAVTLHPLTDAQIQTYLEKQPDLWAAVQADKDLLEACRKPLLLSIFAYAFQQAEKAQLVELKDLREGALRDKLFHTFVERRYKHENARKDKPLPFPYDLMRWVLGYVAMKDVSREEDNQLQWADFVQVMDNAGYDWQAADQMIEMCIRLNIIVQEEKWDQFRFIHLLLRDTLAYWFFEEVTSQHHDKRKLYLNSIENIGAIQDKRVIPFLLSWLKDGDSNLQQRSAQALGYLGAKQVIGELLLALRNEDRSVRVNVVGALGVIGDESAIDTLKLALRDEAWEVGERAAIALRQIGGDRAIQILLLALQDEMLVVRTSAVLALGNISVKAAVETALLDALKNADDTLWSTIVQVLGRLGGEKICEILLHMFQIENGLRRAAIVRALGQNRGAKAVEGLLLAIKDSDDNVRESAVQALERLGENDAVEALLYALQDENSRVCAIAAGALGRLKDERAIEGLLPLLESADRSVRASAAQALGRLRARRAVDQLLFILQDDEYWGVRSSAAEALGLIGDKNILDRLLQALEDVDTAVRVRVVWALGQLGGQKAIGGLILALQDKSRYVQGSAAQALAYIGTPETVDLAKQILAQEARTRYSVPSESNWFLERPF